MLSTVELTDNAIRLCRSDNGRIVGLESYPLPDGVEAVAALAGAPLPKPLGRVRLVIRHADMLLRTMVQPPMPQERLDHIVRFEMQSASPEGLQDLRLTWRLLGIGGTGDMRILVMLGKRSLVDQLRTAVQQHGGRLESIVHPAVGLYHAWRTQEPNAQGSAVLCDCGGANVHFAFVHDGELVFFRSHAPGSDKLAEDVAALRGIGVKDARQLLRKLGKGAPDDIMDLVHRYAMSIGSAIGNNIRFLKAQLQLERFDPQVVQIAGAGARLPRFNEWLAEQTRCPVRLLNPFALRTTALVPADMDALAELPSPWAVALGASGAATPELDVMEDVRAERASFWRGVGALRVALAAAAALMLSAAVVQALTAGIQTRAIERLEGDDKDGLVPHAAQLHAELDTKRAELDALRKRMRFLDDERRPARLAVEGLNVIASLQDPNEMPVYVTSFAVRRPQPDQVQIELMGHAVDAKNRTKAEIINGFKKALQERYPVIEKITELRVGVDPQRQPFHWLIDIAPGG